jgi:hypothetical protein
MDKILDTLYAKNANPSDPGCKSCKNKPKLQNSGIFWVSIWMIIMSVYGNAVLFYQLYSLIFG